MSKESGQRIQAANPMHMLLLADNSGSLKGAPASAVTEAIRNWIIKLQMVSLGRKPYFKFSFIVFGSSSEVVAEAVDVNDVDAEAINIDGGGGTTNMAAALVQARELIERHAEAHHCPPFVFVFTDGSPSLDGKSSDEPHTLRAGTALKNASLPCGSPRIITLGFGSVNDSLMSTLASRPEFYKKVANAQELVQLLPSIGTPTQVGGRPSTVESMEERIAEQNI